MTYTPETDFGRSVRDDAIKCGLTPEVAALIAQGIEHPPGPETIDRMSPRLQAMHGVRLHRVDELADLAAAVGCPALLPALRAAGLPMNKVRALVRDAIDTRTMTVHGARLDNLRAAVSAAAFWSHR
jgi:hypothetical protein